jgi:hypothetical protein
MLQGKLELVLGRVEVEELNENEENERRKKR